LINILAKKRSARSDRYKDVLKIQY